MKKTLILSTLLSSILFASIPQATVSTKDSDLKITIYNNNLAFVNDKRSTDVILGHQNIVYEGIPKNVISESVIPTFSGIDVDLYSQNYVYNLVNLRSLIESSIDTDVEYYRNNYLNLKNPEVFDATLIASSPVIVKDHLSGKIITLTNPNQIIFAEIPEDMITKPSLVWNVETEGIGRVNIDLKYLTTGISWKSDYVLNLSEKSLDINGWITINNNSGVSYENAQITCLAGQTNRAPREVMAQMASDTIVYKSGGMKRKQVKEESFSGYHIYKIPFKETIGNKEKKQISFIDKKGVSYLQYGYGQNNYFDNYGKMKMVFNNVVEFKNDKSNNMGIPLPSGIIRMYKKDSKGETHFIGEDRIGNIPNKETVKLTIGTMFDVVGEKKITKFKADKFNRYVQTTYEVRNRGKEPTTVKIEERIPTYGRKIKIGSSCDNQCSFEKETAFNRIFTIKLKAEEVYKFTSEFNVSYH